MTDANVRAGASTEAERVTTLPKGTEVEVLEKAAGRNWYRIAQDGEPLGFIYAPLIEPAPE